MLPARALRLAALILERYFGADHKVSAREIRIAADCAELETE